MSNFFSKFFPQKTVKISVERLKELEHRSNVLDNVLDTMGWHEDPGEMRCNLELVVSQFKIPEMKDLIAEQERALQHSLDRVRK